MIKILMVGLGGFIGSILRYLVGIAVLRLVSGNFPLGTWVVNFIGCLLIGYFSHHFELKNMAGTEAYLLIVVGVLGGFTTFSAFGFETVFLIRNGMFFLACLNVLGQVSVCLLAVWIGHNIKLYL